MKPLAWKVPSPFIERVVVAASDIDEMEHTNNVVYLGWLEQAAWAHSKSLGFSMDDYRRLGCGMVARRHELDYLLPTFLGEELLIGTWISGNDGKLSTYRDYQIIRAADGKTVLTGRTHWVCVDMVTGRARRMPPEFIEGYRVTVPGADA
ncbi:MAG TPA: thioesterase family protein [Gammaproteobacteria bacterium]|nr:thioesterase family protein [Gammaproteobacteria bacterium]